MLEEDCLVNKVLCHFIDEDSKECFIEACEIFDDHFLKRPSNGSVLLLIKDRCYLKRIPIRLQDGNIASMPILNAWYIINSSGNVDGPLSVIYTDKDD